jgi:hypothetical protein
MAQDSIAYGESLLANIRDRNDKLRSQAKKEAKKDQWKSLAVNIGMSVADDIYSQKQAQLLNNEENLANKLKTTNALNTSLFYTNHDKNSKAFTGGEMAYWRSQSSPEVDNYLKGLYAEGTYNQNEFNLLKQQLTNSWAEELYKENQGGLKLTQEFLSLGGGEKDAYINKVKKHKGESLIGGIASLVGKSTGLLKSDLHNSTLKLLESSDKLTQYESSYKSTGDSGLAAFITEQGLLEGVDLKSKPPTYGTPQAVENDFGGKDYIIPMTTYTTDGSIKSITMISADSNGNFNFDTSERATKKKEFSLLSSQIAKAPNKIYLDAGKKALMGIGGERSEKLTEAFENIITEAGHRSTTDTGEKMMLSLNETAHSKAGAIIYRAKTEGWATSAEAMSIAGEMIAGAYIEKNENRALADAGLANPYHTMFAIESAIDGGKMNNGDAIAELGNDSNILNLYQAYRTETIDGRKAIDDKLQANNYFKGKTGALFGQLHQTIKSVIDQGIEVDVNILIAEYDKLYGTEASGNTETKTETEVVVKDKVKVTDELISSMPIPPPLSRFSSKDDIQEYKRIHGKQKEEYKKILKAQKTLQNNTEMAKRRGINTSAGITLSQKYLNDLYANYINIYGSSEG